MFVGGSAWAALGLLIWRGGTVPAWLIPCLIVVAVTAVILARRDVSSQLEPRIDEAQSERDLAYEDADTLAWGLERHETYSRHVAATLDALQRVVSGDIGVPIPRYIEDAVLEPARDLLSGKPTERVRLSVLLPRLGDDRWEMVWAAGHSLAGKAKYNERIVDTQGAADYPSPTECAAGVSSPSAILAQWVASIPSTQTSSETRSPGR